MVETSFDSIKNTDVTLFLVEATSGEIGKGDNFILDKIKEQKQKTILVINKIDLVKKEKLLKLIETYSKEYEFEAVVPVSALKNEHTVELLDEIEKNLPERTSIL